MIMYCSGLFQDLVIMKHRNEFFDLPNNVVDGMFPYVP